MVKWGVWMKNFNIFKILPTFLIKSNKILFTFSLLTVFIFSLGVFSLKKDISHRIWFKKGDPFLNKYDSFIENYGNDDLLVIILENEKGLFTPSYAKELYLLTKKLENVPLVLRAESMANVLFSTHRPLDHSNYKSSHIHFDHFFPDLKSLDSAFLEERKKKLNIVKNFRDFYLSSNFKTSIIYLYLKKVNPPDYQLTLKKTKEILKATLSKETRFFMTGNSVLAEAYKKAPVDDMKLIMPLGLFILITLLFFIFRNFLGVFIPLGHLFLLIFALLGIQGHLKMTMNSVTSMAPLILMAIGLLDSIHLLTTYYKSRMKKSRLWALLCAIKINIFPTFLTSFTTAIGFFALSTSKIAPISNLGTICGIGVLLAWPLTYFFIPFVLLIFKKKSKPKNIIPFKAKLFLHLIKNKKKIFLSSSFILILLGGGFAFQNEVNSDFENYFPEKTPFRVANQKLEKNIGGSSTIHLLIQNEDVRNPKFLKKIEDLTLKLEDLKGVTKVFSLLDIIKNSRQLLFENDEKYNSLPPDKEQIKESLFFYQLYEMEGKELYRYAKRDFSEMKITLFWKGFSSKEIKRGVREIEKLLKYYNLKGSLNGKVLFMKGLDSYILKTFLMSLILTITCLTLLMMILFKSFRIGLFAMVPNVIPLTLGVAALGLFGKGLDVSAVLIGSISLGISVDDTIFFMSHYYRKTKKFENHLKAIEETIKETGHTLYITTITLASIIGLFTLGSFGPNKVFGFMTSFILICAFLFDLTLLPILLLKKRDYQT